MRKKLHTLLALSLLSAATLAVSCNKDNKDPDFGNGGVTPESTVSEGTDFPDNTTNKYYYNKTSKTLFELKGDTYIAKRSLKDYQTGSKIYYAAQQASNSFGTDKDFFVNTTTGEVYQKKNGLWTAVSDEVYIRDPKFKAALLATGDNGGTIDKNGDGKISISEVNQVVALRVPSAGITSLDGIELFKNITLLEAKENQLTTVHLESLTKLKQIDLTGNQLKGVLDFKKLVELEPANTKIFRGGSNSAVQKVEVISESVANALNNSEGTNKYTAGEVSAYIDFDPVVLGILTANSSIDANSDGKITVREAERYEGVIDISNADVKSLKGLENFKNISVLKVSAPEGSTLTLTDKKFSLANLTKLTTLEVHKTNLEELQINNLPELKALYSNGGTLKTVSITQTPKLETLFLERNSLTSISSTFFVGLNKLKALNLMGNDISGDIDLTPIETSLVGDAANNIQIMKVCRDCGSRRNNAGVRYIYVKTQAEASALIGADGKPVYKSNAGGAEDNTVITIADARLRTLVSGILRGIDWTTYNRRPVEGPYTQSDIDKITTLEIDNHVTNLAGLEHFRKLKKLVLYPQGPTNIDVTGLSDLEELEITGGTIQTVTGVSNALKKVILIKAGNITKLDLTRVSSIETINIVEQSTNAGHIECIALPPSKEAAIKASLYVKTENGTIDNDKTELYRSKVQSTPCN
jgi:leucine rich repeat domain protein